MVTDNYLVVRREGSRARRVEFFFDSRSPTSIASALRAAREYAEQCTAVAQLESDATAAATKSNAPIVSATPVQVFAHGVRGLADLHCLGGCAICCPHNPDEQDEPEPPPEAA